MTVMHEDIVDVMRRGPIVSYRIAIMLKARRENISRHLQSMKRKGIVRCDGQIWTLAE